MGKTLFDKVWDSHVVKKIDKGPDVLFIDRHMVHEVTSPVAFLGLKNRDIKVLFPKKHLPQLITIHQPEINIFRLKIIYHQSNSKPLRKMLNIMEFHIGV